MPSPVSVAEDFTHGLLACGSTHFCSEFAVRGLVDRQVHTECHNQCRRSACAERAAHRHVLQLIFHGYSVFSEAHRPLWHIADGRRHRWCGHRPRRRSPLVQSHVHARRRGTLTHLCPTVHPFVPTTRPEKSGARQLPSCIAMAPSAHCASTTAVSTPIAAIQFVPRPVGCSAAALVIVISVDRCQHCASRQSNNAPSRRHRACGMLDSCHDLRREARAAAAVPPLSCLSSWPSAPAVSTPAFGRERQAAPSVAPALWARTLLEHLDALCESRPPRTSLLRLHPPPLPRLLQMQRQRRIGVVRTRPPRPALRAAIAAAPAPGSRDHWPELRGALTSLLSRCTCRSAPAVWPPAFKASSARCWGRGRSACSAQVRASRRAHRSSSRAPRRTARRRCAAAGTALRAFAAAVTLVQECHRCCRLIKLLSDAFPDAAKHACRPTLHAAPATGAEVMTSALTAMSLAVCTSVPPVDTVTTSRSSCSGCRRPRSRRRRSCTRARTLQQHRRSWSCRCSWSSTALDLLLRGVAAAPAGGARMVSVRAHQGQAAEMLPRLHRSGCRSTPVLLR
jgi:hypothetical protein